VALRASCAAFEARFENTNARMLKNNPATEATLPQFPARNSIICRSKDYVTVRRPEENGANRRVSEDRVGAAFL
jgi:hypothetical protein